MIPIKKRIELAALQFQAFEHTPVGVVAIDSNRNIVYWNPQIARWSGILPSKILGKSLTDRYPTLAASKYKSRFDEIFAGGPPSLFSSNLHGHIIPAPGSNGEMRRQDVTVSGVEPLDGGTDLFALFIIQDVTDLTKSIRQAKKSEKQYRRIVEEASDVVYTIDPDGYFTYVNRPAEILTGYSQDELTSMHFTELLPDEDKEQVLAYYLNQRDKKIRETLFSFPIRPKSGKLIWVEQRVVLLEEGTKVVGLQSIMRDITEQKQAEHSLLVAHRELDNLVKERTAELEVTVAALEDEVAERTRAEAQLRTRTIDLKIINDLNHAVNSGIPLSELIEMISDRVREHLLSYGAAIYLVDPSTQTLMMKNNPLDPQLIMKIAATLGFERPLIWFGNDRRELPWKLLATGKSRVFDTPKSIEKWMRYYFTDVLQTEPDRASQLSEKIGEIRKLIGINSLLVVPLVTADASVGLIEIASGGNFSEMDVKRIELLAEQITALIQRKLGEEQLLLSDTIISNVPTLILVCSAEGDMIFASPSIQQLLGYSNDEVLGHRWFDSAIRDPDEAEQIRTYLKGAASGKIPLETEPYERMLIDKQGQGHWILWQDTKGPGSLVIRIGHDITHRKESDESLQKLSRAIAQTADSVIITDTNGIIEFANPSFETETGYSRDEVIGKSPAILKSGKHDKAFYAHMWHTILSGETYQDEVINKRKNGELFIEAKTITPIKNDEGEITHFISTGRDITEAKEAADNLAMERGRLAITLQGITDGVIATDENGLIMLINPAAEHLTGQAAEEVLWQPADSIIANPENDPVFARSLRDLLEDKVSSIEALEFELQTRPGSLLTVAINIAQLRNPDGVLQGSVIVFRDITERQQLEAERIRSQKMESLGVLAGGLAHDFNNFLMTIMLNIGTARLKVEDPKVLELLQAAENSVDRATGITMQLLTFSRGGEPVKMVMDMRPLIKESAKFALLGKPVEARLSLDENLPLVEADSGQLNQVMNNLLINAVQAMPKGGTVSISAKPIEIEAGDARKDLDPGTYVEVSVEDEGIGIPAAILDSIFDPYFTTRSTGSGLGLSSCYSIIKKHDGWITVKSEIEVGSTFTIYIPAKAGQNQQLIDNSLMHPGTGSILIMDDDEAIRIGLVSLLEVLGYTALATADGTEAIEMYKKAQLAGEEFDLVILDITVPGGLGGIETVKKILKINPSARVIVSSGYATDPVMANFSDYGFKAVLPKPFNPEKLEAVLGAVLPR